MDLLIQSAAPNTAEPSNLEFEQFKIEAFEDREGGGSQYRIIVDGQVKIITIRPNILSSKRLISFSSAPGGTVLPALPGGDWNHGVISQCPLTKKPVWTTMLEVWPGCTTLWHDVTIDQSELEYVMPIRTNVHIVTCAQYPNTFVVYKHATFPSKIPLIDHESSIYKIITEARGDRPGSW